MTENKMDTPLRLAGVIRESIVDGPGIRMVVFAQGCPHRCPGCHNPDTHDPESGYITSVGRIIEAAKKNPLLKGITLSGGEPFSQAVAFAVLARAAHAAGLHVITYTGYTFEELTAGRNEWMELLKETDILVDGRYIEAERDLMLRFRGSRNQRVIDVRSSLSAGRVVEQDW